MVECLNLKPNESGISRTVVFGRRRLIPSLGLSLLYSTKQSKLQCHFQWHSTSSPPRSGPRSQPRNAFRIKALPR